LLTSKLLVMLVVKSSRPLTHFSESLRLRSSE
jgi:hypothetical protein